MENTTYIVRKGDTILSVSENFGIRVIDLIQANNLEDTYFLTPGEEIIIPGGEPYGFTYYVVEKGDNLYQIAKKYNIRLEDLVTINGLENDNYIFPGQRLLVPKMGVYAYITKEGDTLRNVSSLLGVSPDEILVYNKRIYLLPEQLIAYRIKENS